MSGRSAFRTMNLHLICFLTVRWDPTEQDPTIFACSSDLYVCYRIVQIQTHRPLMARTGMSSSTIVCATSARYVKAILSHLIPFVDRSTNSVRSCASVLRLQMTKDTPLTSNALVCVFLLRHPDI